MNIHLFTVKSVYFCTNGLNSERYRAKDSWAEMQSRSPQMFPTLALPAVALARMIMTAPQHPISTPTTFFQVMGSFRMRKESIMAKIGIEVVMMLELLGEVMFSPMVYEHWLNTRAKMPAPASLKISFTGTCSFLVKNEVIQKRTAPPRTRKLTRSMPSMPLSMASLPTGAISPQNAPAQNMHRWAIRGRLLSIFPFQ